MRTITTVVALIAILTIVGSSPAGTINLNDMYNAGNPFNGQSVSFSDLIESNGNGQTTTNYYQTPSVSTNTLNLTPEGLQVEILPGPGSSTIASHLDMTIGAQAGLFINTIAFQQLVDYSLFGARTNDAVANLTVNYTWEVLAGASAGVTGNGSISRTASSSPNTSGTWTVAFDVNIGAAAAGAQRVKFGFNTTISGVAQRSGSVSVGSMPQPGIDVMVTVVPEPAAEMLVVAVGLAAFAVRRSLSTWK